MSNNLEMQVALAKEMFDDGVPDLSMVEVKPDQTWEDADGGVVITVEEVWAEQGLWAVINVENNDQMATVFLSESQREYWTLIRDVA